MMKSISLLVMVLCVSVDANACISHDQGYFKTHPKALQEALTQCPDKAPKLVQCDELQKIAVKINDLVNELRMSPQGYGQTLLNLQEKIATQMASLPEASEKSELKDSLDKDNQELQERMAVVNWLESPES